MATQTKQGTRKAHGIYDRSTLLVFKRTIALLFALSPIAAGAGIGMALANHKHDAVSGTVVAYYENDYQRYAVDMLTETNRIEQWPCLYQMWMRESNWRPAALNKTSKASGIAQLKPITWRIIQFKQTTDGYLQVDAGLLYIQRHYGGNICRAYAHHLAKGWY